METTVVSGFISRLGVWTLSGSAGCYGGLDPRWVDAHRLVVGSAGSERAKGGSIIDIIQYHWIPNQSALIIIAE